MQAHIDSKEPLIKRPFDLQEAVVLLDVYLSTVKKGVPMAKAAEAASLRLRSLAERNGYAISESFRSAQGLFNRLRSIAGLYEGRESKSAPGTVVFAEAVTIYKNDRKRYDEILSTENTGAEQVKTDKEAKAEKHTPARKNSKLKKTKFIRHQRDQKLKEQYPTTFKKVYYALKNATGSGKNDVTATDLFLALNKTTLRKDIAAVLAGASWAKETRNGHYVFYDKEQEERRKKQMEEKQKAAEQEFFQWLPSAVPPLVLKDIQTSYVQINTLLVKSKVLPQSITNVTLIGQIEVALRQTKRVFANKRLRNTAAKLLAAYLAYLREKKGTVESAAPQLEVEVEDSWIKFDFTNSREFERTKPVYCSVAGDTITGKNWARILVAITEREIEKRNPALDELYKKPLTAERKGRPYLMKERIEGLNCSQLSNGYWLNVNHSIPRLLELIQALCLHCGYTKEQVLLYGVARGSASARKEKSTVTSTGNGVPIEKAEEYLRSVGLRGATVKELIEAVQPGAAVYPTTIALDEYMDVICMPGSRYVHTDSFVDLDEAEEALGQILKTHFAQFGGYSNNQLLFGAASQELSMFLNDNDCENIDAVYAIARFLFEKKAVAGAPYKFSMPHIFEKEPDYPMTLRGLMIHLARSNGGLLYVSDAKDYLQKTMLTYGGIGQLLQLGSSNTFLIYDSDRYLLSESLGIDDAWCMRMHDRLDDLFRKANVAYVIPRDINVAWLTTLPALPHGLDWTLLLLQEVLDKYPAIGFKSVSPDLNQSHDTLAAAFVPIDSPLQTFPDVVTLFMEEHHDLPMRMPGEDLRLELRDAGMLENSEMIYSLPKALNDYRFAWSNENKTVYVRGNK